MTRDDIIRMARQAHQELVTQDYPGHLGQLDPWTIRLLERFAALVAAAERAACIDDCNAEARDDGTAQRIVERIRARGKA
jgi:hypothetical protein